MNTRTQKKIISPEEESVIDSSSSGQVTVAAREARAPLKTIVVMKPRLPAAIPDEKLDYYAWVFQCAVKRRWSTVGGSPSRELVRSAR